MGLPAFTERFESLAAETWSRSQQVTHAAEVLSIGVGALIGSTNSLVEALGDFRNLLLMGGLELRGLFTDLQHGETAPGELEKYATTMASMKRFRRRIDRPYFADVEGSSAIDAAQRLENLKTNTAVDGRTTRRLGKRVREAVENLEKQRLRFIVTMDNLMARMEDYAAKQFAPNELGNAYTQALGEQSIKRFPEVNAHLAR